MQFILNNMLQIFTKLNSESFKIKHLLLFLFIYIIAHFICFAFFYWGFIGAYSWLYTHLLKHGINFKLLEYVPYHSWSPLLAAFLHPLFALGVLLTSVPLIGKVQKIRWETIGQYKYVRFLAFSAAAILAWELSTYDYNYYLDTPQYFDRVLLVIFALLILRNPFFVLPFLVMSLLYRSQFNYPIGGFPLFDKRLLFDLLILLYSYIVIREYVSDFKVNLFFVMICVVMAGYFASGLAKITHSPHGYEWLLYNKPKYLFINVRQLGWLRSASPITLVTMKNFLENYGQAFQALVLLTELSSLFVLWKRKIGIAILMACIVMHIGIFIFGSMFFWKWMVIDVILIYLFLRMDKQEEKIFFNPRGFKISLFLIITSLLWLKPLSVEWFDTPFNQFFTYEVTDEKGNIYHLERNSMNPYHQFFQYGQFLYLVNKDVLPVSSFGYVHTFQMASFIKQCGDHGIAEMEAEWGENHYDSVKVEKYIEFIKTYFSTRNKRGGLLLFPYLSAPNHLYNQEEYPIYTGKQKIKKFSVIFNQTYFNGRQIIYISKKTLQQIDIP